jgi:hypothetical protein
MLNYTALKKFRTLVIWNISQTGTSLCDPYSPLQGHAIWHILDAVAAFCLFMYYASEHTGVESQKATV